MATYYVGPSSAGAADGTSWANRYGTLNAAEDRPVAAGDTVYVGPGTYREQLTVDVSGSSGSPITYIGDYTGAVTDGVGGVVRVTGSDDDIATARTSCVAAASKNYRTFRGFTLDLSSSHHIGCSGACSNWIVEDCYFSLLPSNSVASAYFAGTGTSNTVRRCYFIGRHYGAEFSHSSSVSSAGHLVENCIFVGLTRGVSSVRVGGITIKNCSFWTCTAGIRVATALAGGQTVTVNNCLFQVCGTALQATATGEITENYNALYFNSTDRTSTSTGANSNAYPALPDTRWFFETVLDDGTLLSPFDLASYAPLINVAGTSPATSDMRGTGAVGAQREWGALEYDPSLDFEAGAGAAIYRRVARVLG